MSRRNKIKSQIVQGIWILMIIFVTAGLVPARPVDAGQEPITCDESGYEDGCETWNIAEEGENPDGSIEGTGDMSDNEGIIVDGELPEAENDGYYTYPETDADASVTYEAGNDYQEVSTESIACEEEGQREEEAEVGAATIQEGTYSLYAELGDRKCYMSLAGGTTADGGNIQTTAYSTSNSLKFRFESVGGGYYKLVSIKTGYAVTESGGNVQQNTWKGDTSQQWSLTKSGTAYRLRNRKSGKYLNVDGGNPKYTTNINTITSGEAVTESQIAWFLEGTGTNVESCSVYVPDQKYTGKAIVPNPEVRFNGTLLTKGTHYTVKCSNNVNIGTAKLTITGTGEYTGTKTVDFRITTLISDAKFTGVGTAYRYTGKAIKPVPKLEMGGKTLSSGTDYTVSYSNNTKSGTGRVTVTGKGNYGGTAYKDFYIVPGVKTVSEADTYYVVMHDNPAAALGASGMVNNTRVALAEKKATETQKFRVRKNADGTYRLVAARSELVLASAQNKKTAGNPVVLYQDTGKAAQHWKVVTNSDGSFSFNNTTLGLSLGTNTPGGYKYTGTGTILRVCEPKNVTSQKFWLIKCAAIDSSMDGRYSVSCKANKNYVLHVASSSKDENANICLQKYSGISSQKFELVYSGSGYYRIVNVNSGKVLGTESGADGANIRQEAWSGSRDQRWSVTKNSDGTCCLKNMDGMYAEVASGSIANGRNIVSKKKSSSYWILTKRT